MTQHLQDCIKKGAKITAGGLATHPLNLSGGTFFNPTVVTNVTKDMLPFQEETFGPLAPLMAFDTEEEAVEIANSTRYGLAAYFCTKDLGRAFRVSEVRRY